MNWYMTNTLFIEFRDTQRQLPKERDQKYKVIVSAWYFYPPLNRAGNTIFKVGGPKHSLFLDVIIFLSKR